MLAELKEVPDQLRHFCGTFRRISRNSSVSLRVFSWVEAVMSLMSPMPGLSGAVPSFFSFSLFIACFVLVAHNIVALQFLLGGIRVFISFSSRVNWILTNLNYPQISPEVAARQHMGLVEYYSVGLRSVNYWSGVKMWHFQLRYWAVLRTQPVILSCPSCCWGLLFQGSGLFTALAPT